jgi:predicted dehydrogenase
LFLTIKLIDMQKRKSKSLSRRSFIGKIGVATAAFTVVPKNVLAGRGYQQPSDIPNLASIGLGMQGSSNLATFSTPENPPVIPPAAPRTTTQASDTQQAIPWRKGVAPAQGTAPAQRSDLIAMRESYFNGGVSRGGKLANIYAICDVDSNQFTNILKYYPKAKTYADWRVMLEKEPSIDAVVVATPDHNHAIIAANFIRAKKHVYSEKPMCKTVVEARTLRQLSKEFGVATQVGNQGHATEGTRKTVEWIQSGTIGNVREVHCTSGGSWGGWPAGSLTRPAGVTVPKNMNWDLWLGPAPVKPYHPDIHPFYWRGHWDYGTSTIGDASPHIIDAVIWALNLGLPNKVYASSVMYGTEYFPYGSQITFEFPARGLMPEVKLIWSDGGIRMERPKTLEPNRAAGAAVYYGEKGIIQHGTHGANPELVPLNPGFVEPTPWIPRTSDNYRDWIEAIKAGRKSNNDYSVSSIHGEIVALGIIAMLVRNKNIILEYDGVNGRFTNSEEANSLLHYEYRQGWTL